MAALPVSTYAGNAAYSGRGVVGTQNINNTQRVDQEQMLHSLFKSLRFYEEKWMIKATIPMHQNEVAHWDIDSRGDATNAVYRINEQGTQVGSVNNSVGVAQTALAEVPGMLITLDVVEASPNRYGSVFFYTTMAQSVSKRDPVKRGESEMGKVVAEQLDSIVMGMFDVNAQDLYPRATVLTDAALLSTDVFNYAYVVKLENYVLNGMLEPPEGEANFPVILPVDAEAGLLLDTATSLLLRDTSARADPMSKTFLKGFIGSLRCFDFYRSNRLVPTNIAGVFVYHGYIFTREGMAVLAMEDPEYGQMPNSSANNTGDSPTRDWATEEMPRPVTVYRHEPGSGALGADVFKNRGAIAEKHTLGFKALIAGRLIRFGFAQSVAGDFGIAVGAGAGGHAGQTGSA